MARSDAEVFRRGALAADAIIEAGYGVRIEKALDPLDPDDFVTIVGRLSSALSKATVKTDVETLNKILDGLDVDWPNLSKKQIDKIVDATASILAKSAEKIIPPVQRELEVVGPRVVKATKRGQKKVLPQRLSAKINIAMSLVDQQIIDHAVGSQSLFITDEYARRAADYSRKARSVVAAGLEKGLGRDEISRDLQNAIGVKPGLRKSKQYWDVVSGVFTNRSRVWGALVSFDEAGVDRYIFEAVLDERTTDQCAALHGKTFSVQNGISQYKAAAAADDPEAVKDIQPWLRVGKDDEGRRILFTQSRDGERTFVGEITRSQVGIKDTTAQTRNMMSTTQLQDAGITMPPLHGSCRSTIVADV